MRSKSGSSLAGPWPGRWQILLERSQSRSELIREVDLKPGERLQLRAVRRPEPATLHLWEDGEAGWIRARALADDLGGPVWSRAAGSLDVAPGSYLVRSDDHEWLVDLAPGEQRVLEQRRTDEALLPLTLVPRRRRTSGALELEVVTAKSDPTRVPLPAELTADHTLALALDARVESGLIRVYLQGEREPLVEQAFERLTELRFLEPQRLVIP